MPDRSSARGLAERSRFSVAHRAVFLALGLMTAIVSIPSKPDAEPLTLMRLATGPTGGTLFPVGGAIANAISKPPGARPCDRGGSCGVPGLIATAQSTAGSVENIELLLSGRAQAALVHADVAFAALIGKLQGIKRDARVLRALAGLYPEAIHVVVRADHPAQEIRALDGAKLAMGGTGSGARYAASIALTALGVTPAPGEVGTLNPGPAAEAMSAGELDGLITVAGIPSPTVTGLSDGGAVRLLPVSGFDAASVIAQHGFFEMMTLPAGSYGDLPQVETVGLRILLVVRADMPVSQAREITRALWHPSSMAVYDKTLPAGVQLNRRLATKGIALKLHPGAKEYYDAHPEPTGEVSGTEIGSSS